MKQDDDKVARFWIEARFSSEVSESASQGYPESHHEAVQEFERLCRRYPCVYLAEYGRYKAGNEFKDDWMYYKWTEATGLGVLPWPFQRIPQL